MFAQVKGLEWTKEPMFDSEEADRLNETPIVGDHREAAFLMDRVQHQVYIQSFMKNNAVSKSGKLGIVCDRYLWTALAYSLVYSPETYEFLRAAYVHSFFRRPDCFVYVNTHPENCARRRPGRSIDFAKTLESLKRLGDAYIETQPLNILEWSEIPVITICGDDTVEGAVQNLIKQLGKHWPELGPGLEQMNLFS
jgi:thymidylate kinase